MKKIWSHLLTISLYCMIGLILFGCVVILPALANESVAMHPEVTFLKLPLLLGLYATAIPCIYAMIVAIQLASTMTNGRAMDVKGAFRHIQICAVIIASLYVGGFMLLVIANAMPAIMAIAGFVVIITCIIIFAGAGLLKNFVLFKQIQI